MPHSNPFGNPKTFPYVRDLNFIKSHFLANTTVGLSPWRLLLTEQATDSEHG